MTDPKHKHTPYVFEIGVFIVDGLKYPMLVLDIKSFIFGINLSNVLTVDNDVFSKLLFSELFVRWHTWVDINFMR